MSEQKKYSPREAAVAVLQKAEEMLKKAEAFKKAQEDVPQKASEEKDATPPDGVQSTPAPQDNPKEQAEGNNEPWGTAPGSKGHFKLAKFCGYVEAKRKVKPAGPAGVPPGAQ